MGDESAAAGPAGSQFIIRETGGWGVAWGSPSCGKTAATPERAGGQSLEMWGSFLFSMRIPRRGDRFNGMATAQQSRRRAHPQSAGNGNRACPEVGPGARGKIPNLNFVALETPSRWRHCFKPQLPQIYAADRS